MTGGPSADVDQVLGDPQPWMRDALCREHPEVSFFVERGEDVRPAKALCSACLVRGECIAYAAAQGFEFGIWGGLSARQIPPRT
jgi:WhiB family redox-sensing transcriptional regulator